MFINKGPGAQAPGPLFYLKTFLWHTEDSCSPARKIHDRNTETLYVYL